MTDFNQLIKLHYDRYTPQERVVADNLLEFPYFILEKNISNFAASINVSRNSITRFCKVLGFNGYTDFKYEFSKSLTQKKQSIETEKNQLVADIVSSYKEKLNQIITENLLKDKEILALSRQICLAKSVKLIGTGQSAPPALQLKYSLQTLKIYVEMLDSLTYSEDLSFLFNQEDVVLVYSVSGKSLLTNKILAGARKKKCQIFMITTAKNTAISSKHTFLLPNVSKNNPYIFSNHTLFYLFNDLLCNAICYEQTQRG